MYDSNPAFTITGYTEDGWPIMKASPEYQQHLDYMKSRPSSYRGPSFTAEELDEKCTNAELMNKYYQGDAN